ncbi:F0F1 ATP synthase subunit B family protein [Kiloniella sp. b19]|uniref:F0F1 ATP synthase subunit B family protein n=1 Tax=Kiloniella sp. GXU_MW_B19 TaxID=3141326 RepID=UPI0031D9AE1A
MPQFDPSTWTSQLFWLIVTFGVLYFLMARVALPRLTAILEERENKISGDLEKAERLKQEAEEVLADYQKAIAEARSSASSLLKEASDDIAALSAERQAAFDAGLKEKTNEAEARINDARAEALTSLKDVAADVATAATTKLLGTEVPKVRVTRAVEEAVEKRGEA